MRHIAVGSENPVKIEAARLAFTAVWPKEKWEVVGVKASSGVSDQPMSDTESIRGARNRARAALEATGADFGVGLEGGLQQIESVWFDSGWIIVRDAAGKEGIGSTVRMITPPVMMDYVEQGMELGHVDDLIFKTQNSKQASGHFGAMTNNAVSRTEGYYQGVVSALTRFIHPHLFREENGKQKITICGSIAFYDEMREAGAKLEAAGHTVKLPPKEITDVDGNPMAVKTYYDLRKSTTDPSSWIWNVKTKAMQQHLDKVAWADAVLVLNYDKNDIPNYIGANTLLEMSLAFYLGKTIYLLNPIPDLSYTEEILGMHPTVLEGSLAKINRTTEPVLTSN